MLDETVHQTDITHAVTGSGEVAPQPTPRPDKALLDAYEMWLDREKNWLRWERYGVAPDRSPLIGSMELVFRDTRTGEVYDRTRYDNPASRFDHNQPGASTRAATVLDAVGCDWISRGRRQPTMRDPVFDLLDHEAELLRRSDAALSHDWDGEGQVAANQQREAEAVLMSTAPMTVAGFAAVVERWIEREACVTPEDGTPYDLIMSLIKASKATAEFAAPKPDPIEVLWRQRYDACRKYEVEPVTPNDDDDDSPSSILLKQVWNAEDLIMDAAPSLTQAAASALIHLAFSMNVQDKIADVDPKDVSTDWVAVNTLKALRPYLTGLLAETVADVLDHPDRPLWDSEFCPRDRLEPEQSSTLLAAE